MPSRRAPAPSSPHRLPLVLVALLLSAVAAAGQSDTSGNTPAALAPGSPAGSYALSGFDDVNLFNGNLNFRLPLLGVGGRGAVSHKMTLAVDQTWTVFKEKNEITGVVTHHPEPNWWSGLKPGYGPGVLQARHAGDGQQRCNTSLPFEYAKTLTRLTFTAADGTEYELRDQQTGGEPQPRALCNATEFNRGRVFVTADGSAATFISDADITDRARAIGGDALVTRHSGYLLLRDGTRYRFVDGVAAWVRDRNGNLMTFAYDTPKRLTSAADPLGRQVTILYNQAEGAPYGTCDRITYSGFGGAARVLRVCKSSLGSALRTTRTTDLTTPQTPDDLFPELDGSSVTDYNPTVVSAVWLPDGRRYQLFYNPYGELARVALPTGGAIEYDYAAGHVGGNASGVFGVGTKHVYRRVVERRVYADGASLEGRMTYSRPESMSGNIYQGDVGYVEADQFDAAGALLARARHYFHGSAHSSFNSFSAVYYTGWSFAREYKTEQIETAGCAAATCAAVLRRVEHTWQQRAPVGWWTSAEGPEPPNDPRLVSTVTTVEPGGANLVSKQTAVNPQSGAVGFDQFNNQTDSYEYDYGAGAPGAFVRRTHTEFSSSAAYVGADADPAVGAHLRELPTQRWVSSDAAGATKLSLTDYEYDNYSNDAADARHEPLVARANITGHDTAVYSTAFTRRGNVTGVTAYADAAAATPSGPVTASTQYDVAGSPVKSIDARGHASSIGYADSFCNGAGCAGTALPNTYAFPTSTTSPVPDPSGASGSTTALTTATKYDFRSGLVYSTTDANGQTTTFGYADALDRPTSQVRPDGGRTDVEYGDTVGSLRVRVLTDLDATRRTESLQYFDGLGRAVRSFRRDNQDTAKPWLTSDTQYDDLGRAWRVSNQYRSAGPGSAVNPSGHWTATAYDSLGRVVSVTTPDDPARDAKPANDPTRQGPFENDAKVLTAYSGDKVLVTDQDGKRRISRTDGLGRLTHVWEVTSAAGTGTVTVSFAGVTYNGYLTAYRYDDLGNLREVEQGAQSRFFAYDSLSRLIRAKNPEQGAMAADTDFPALTDSSSGTANSQWSLGYKYDAAGNLTKRKDARNVTATYAYDPVNRNTSVNYSDTTPDVARTYDGATGGRGRAWRSEAAGVSRTTVSQYDAAGRPKASAQQFWVSGAWGASFGVARAYDEAGNVTSQTYPSGRTVSYTYDAAGRPASFSGTLGDGADRDYSKGTLYDEMGGVSREEFGTATALYNRRFYNRRGQLSEVRLGTYHATSQSWWNRGAILNVYSGEAGWTESGKDNNGNLFKQMVFVPNDDSISGWWQTNFFYEYDSLNRLSLVREVQNDQNQWIQDFDYDRWGNRTINAAGTQVFGTSPTYSIPEPQFTVNAANNRLAPPAGYTMTYDAAGNLTQDTYTGSGTRTYDAENRMTSAQFVSGQLQAATYTYDADGRRVKRDAGAAAEVWQVYGVGGELLAEYAAGAAPNAPQKEYGYRAGELLVTLEAGQRVNVALSSNGASATASSTLDATRLPSAAINGDRRGLHWGSDPSSGSGWTDANANTFPDWVEVAFAGSKTIDEIDVFGLQDNYAAPLEPTEAMTSSTYTLTAFTVQYWTGAAWATVPGGAVTGNTKVWRKFTFAPVTTQKIRVVVNSAGGSHSRVVELEAWGAGAEARWLVSDHLGTPRMVIDAGGQLAGVSRHDYLPFGEELVAGHAGRTAARGYVGDDLRQEFTGYERDAETGLDYAQARYYASAQGRFTSTDPLYFQAASAFDPQLFNLYGYARNNPLKFVDPDGERVQLFGNIGWLRNNVLHSMVGGEEQFNRYFEIVNDEVRLRAGADLSQANAGVRELAGYVGLEENFVYYAGTSGEEAASLFDDDQRAVAREFYDRTPGIRSGGYVVGTAGRKGTRQPGLVFEDGTTAFAIIAFNTNAVIMQNGGTGVGNGPDSTDGNVVVEFHEQWLGRGQRVEPVRVFIHESAENQAFAQQARQGRELNYREAHQYAMRREGVIRRALQLPGGFAGGALTRRVPRKGEQ